MKPTTYLNRNRISARNSRAHSPIAGGEKSKAKRASRGMRTILAGVVIITIILVAGVLWPALESDYGMRFWGTGSQAKPIFTLTANLENPHATANFTYGFLSPNLWGLQRGNGNVTMSVYKNDSVHTVSNLSGVSTGDDNGLAGYPSIHFTHNLPLSLNSAMNENLSSFVSFTIISNNPNLYIDVAYDLFLGQGTTLTDEVMVFLYNSYSYKTSGEYGEQLGSVVISTIKDGVKSNITWNFY